jgi:methionine-rich copper-binding protein CopC
MLVLKFRKVDTLLLKRLLITILLLTLLPTTAFAHSGLKSSTPNDKEIITRPLNEIVMEFNTNIEKLSTFTLLDKQGQNVNVDSIAVEGKKLKGALKEPLPHGDYSVHWKIVGEDGHVIERGFTFTVNMPDKVKETAKAAPNSIEQVQQAPISQEQKQTRETASVQANNYYVMILIWTGIGILLMIGVLVITLRRRK